jgi:hypothetical protein
MAPRAKLITFETYDKEIQKLMQLLRDLGLSIPENAKLLSDDLKAFQFLYYAVFADERPADLNVETARIQAGLGDLATKINKAWSKPGSEILRPHLAKMLQGAVRMNDVSDVTDEAANKTCELYVGCLALGRGWLIALDDPDKSSGGLNPDIIIELGGKRWSIAIKTIHGASSQTIFDNIKSAVRQIEKSKIPGIPFINLKNRIDQSKLLSADIVYDTVIDANTALRRNMEEIIRRLRADIVDNDWLEAFQGKLARPLVTFMAQTLATAHVAQAQKLFVPIRQLMVLPVPPLPREPNVIGLDREAWDLTMGLNDELQATP